MGQPIIKIKYCYCDMVSILNGYIQEPYNVVLDPYKSLGFDGYG